MQPDTRCMHGRPRLRGSVCKGMMEVGRPREEHPEREWGNGRYRRPALHRANTAKPRKDESWEGPSPWSSPDCRCRWCIRVLVCNALVADGPAFGELAPRDARPSSAWVASTTSASQRSNYRILSKRFITSHARATYVLQPGPESPAGDLLTATRTPPCYRFLMLLDMHPIERC